MKLLGVMMWFGVFCWSGAAVAQEGTATDKDYTLSTQGSAKKVKLGKDAVLAVSIVGKNGFKVSEETPFTLKLEATSGVKLAAAKFTRKELVDPKSTAPAVKTSYTGVAPGANQIKADVVFFLCTDKLCQRMTAQTSIDVLVE